MSPVVQANNIFVVFGPAGNGELEAIIAQKFGENAKQVWANQWFIVADGTAQEVSAAIGADGAGTTSAVVVSVSSYFGRAPKDIWEWLVVATQRPSKPAIAHTAS